jgi:hypothetical protein
MEHFLDKKYPDLAGSREVYRAAKKARKRGEKPYKRDELIDSYIARLGTLFRDKRGFTHLKRLVADEYITKPEDIPEGYWALQEKIMEKQDRLSGWQNMSEEEKNKFKRENSKDVLSDQALSLERWVDFLASPDTDYISDDLKYWIFRSIVKMQEFDKETGEFGKHSKGTVKLFPEINKKALKFIVEAMLNKYAGKKPKFELDIQENEQRDFEKFLEKEDFAKLYAWAAVLYSPIPERLLKVTEGEWRKFDRGSDPNELVKTIHGKGTGWCTAGINKATAELDEGDFYVYYSKDDEGNATIPRITIRKGGNDIIEVCGIATKQNIDEFMEEVLTEKLDEFPEREKYRKKEQHLKELRRLAKKQKKGEEFTKDELVFVYEQKERTQYFGNEKDERIEELKKGRKNKIADYCVMYDCTPEQIATRPEEITENTIVYWGNLTQKDTNILNNRKNPITIDGNASFYGNTSFTSMPEGIVFNGNANFEGCSSLTAIPKGASFNRNAYFFNCTSLAEIPEETIFKENVSFYGCTSLREVPESVLKKEEGTITLPLHLKEKYSKFPNVRFV